jgi:hypothetical protein
MTQIPKTIEVDADLLSKIIDLSRWVLQMPEWMTDDEQFYLGDRFHDKVFEFRMKAIPADIFEEDDVFVSHFELVDDKMCVMFGLDPMPEQMAQQAEYGLFRCELVAK